MSKIEEYIEVKRGGFTWDYGILVDENGKAEMIWHKDPAARCLLATWQQIEPEIIAAMDAEAQEEADLIYKEWQDEPSESYESMYMCRIGD